jgi:hypothetical protein
MVRAGVLRLVLSVLVAITLVAGMTGPCEAHSNGPALGATLAMSSMASGMGGCHHMPAKAPGHAAKSLGCPHCMGLGGGVLVPAPVGFKVDQLTPATPVARVAALPAGLLTAPDTGPPKGLRI